jgi:hypothetical protein
VTPGQLAEPAPGRAVEGLARLDHGVAARAEPRGEARELGALARAVEALEHHE